MKRYYLFGGEAVTKYRKNGVESLKDVPYGLFAWEDGKTNEIDLLQAYNGWELYSRISKSEYDYLFSQVWS